MVRNKATRTSGDGQNNPCHSPLKQAHSRPDTYLERKDTGDPLLYIGHADHLMPGLILISESSMSQTLVQGHAFRMLSRRLGVTAIVSLVQLSLHRARELMTINFTSRPLTGGNGCRFKLLSNTSRYHRDTINANDVQMTEQSLSLFPDDRLRVPRRHPAGSFLFDHHSGSNPARQSTGGHSAFLHVNPLPPALLAGEESSWD